MDQLPPTFHRAHVALRAFRPGGGWRVFGAGGLAAMAAGLVLGGWVKPEDAEADQPPRTVAAQPRLMVVIDEPLPEPDPFPLRAPGEPPVPLRIVPPPEAQLIRVNAVAAPDIIDKPAAKPRSNTDGVPAMSEKQVNAEPKAKVNLVKPAKPATGTTAKPKAPIKPPRADEELRSAANGTLDKQLRSNPAKPVKAAEKTCGVAKTHGVGACKPDRLAQANRAKPTWSP